MHRAIQKYLEDLLAEQILAGTFKTGDTIKVTFNEQEGRLEIAPASTGKKKAKKEEESEEKPEEQNEEKTDPSAIR